MTSIVVRRAYSCEYCGKNTNKVGGPLSLRTLQMHTRENKSCQRFTKEKKQSRQAARKGARKSYMSEIGRYCPACPEMSRNCFFKRHPARSQLCGSDETVSVVHASKKTFACKEGKGKGKGKGEGVIGKCTLYRMRKRQLFDRDGDGEASNTFSQLCSRADCGNVSIFLDNTHAVGSGSGPSSGSALVSRSKSRSRDSQPAPVVVISSAPSWQHARPKKRRRFDGDEDDAPLPSPSPSPSPSLSSRSCPPRYAARNSASSSAAAAAVQGLLDLKTPTRVYTAIN